MKKMHFFGVIALALSFFGFYLIENVFTFEPYVISGNGNLGILIILLFSPIFITSYFTTYKLAKRHLENRKLRLVALCLALICCASLINQIVNYATELITALGGAPENPDSKIYRYPWMNQFTNSIYFNVYTFLFTHLLAVIVGAISAISEGKRGNDEI